MVVDPRKLFSGARPYADEIDSLREVIDLPKSNPRKLALIRVKGANFERYTIIRTAESDGVWQSYTVIVDSRVGFNVVYEDFAEEGRGDTQTVTMNYARVGGVLVPAGVILSVSSKEVGYLAFQRVLELEEAAVNTPLGDDVFSYASLGLGDGDRLLVRIEKCGYVLKSGSLVRCSKEDTEDTGLGPRPRRSAVFTAFVVFNVVVLMSLVIWLAIRKRSEGK